MTIVVSGPPTTGKTALALGCEPLGAGDLRQAWHLEAMAIVIIRLWSGGYDPYSVFGFVSSGRPEQPFASR
jgi:predicted Zn-dependent protease